MIPPISSDALQVVQEGAPVFLVSVDRLARLPHTKSHMKIIRISLATFYDDPLLLYASVWYAATKGVHVIFYSNTLFVG